MTRTRLIALLVGVFTAAPAGNSQISRTDDYLPGPIAVGAALQVGPSLAGTGVLRAYVHPVAIDVSASRTIRGIDEKLTMASLDASIPWSRRRGMIEGTSMLSTLGIGLTLVDTEQWSPALGPGVVIGGGLFIGRSIEFFGRQRIAVILVADEDARSFETGALIYGLDAGVRIYP